MRPPRVTLRGHERRGPDLFLCFAVDEGDGEMRATVRVGMFGRAEFPHEMCSSGASFGPAIDRALVERATQMIAMFEAADTWRAMRRHKGRRAA